MLPDNRCVTSNCNYVRISSLSSGVPPMPVTNWSSISRSQRFKVENLGSLREECAVIQLSVWQLCWEWTMPGKDMAPATRARAPKRNASGADARTTAGGPLPPPPSAPQPEHSIRRSSLAILGQAPVPGSSQKHSVPCREALRSPCSNPQLCSESRVSG